ncbi:hypothetical protein N9015_01170 [Akkermansiaceae bacterium]|nr:hypothetical protein [Akkermansiaceae bacterium]
MDFYSLYDRLKNDYKKPLDLYCEKYPNIGKALLKELKEKEFVSHMTYGDVIGLGSVTGCYGSPYDLFIEYEVYEENMKKLQEV